MRSHKYFKVHLANQISLKRSKKFKYFSDIFYLFVYIAYLLRISFSYFKEWQLIKLLILVILILILRAEKMETHWHFILWNPNPCLLLAIVFPKLENFGFNHCVFKINLLQVKQKVLTICLKNVYLVRR